MGELLHFPLGGGANSLHVRRYTTSADNQVDVLTLAHRGGECVVWQTGDEGTLDEAIAVWQACGARLAASGMGGHA